MKKYKKYFLSPFFWLITLFILSSVFRLFNLNLMEFKADEAANLFQGYGIVKGYYFPLVGTLSSVGIYNFPLFIGSLAIPLFIFSDPIFVTFIIAFLNVCAILLFYIYIKKFYGNFVAIVASLLLALSPWSILYSRKIWEPDVLLVIEIPLLYFLHKLIFQKKAKAAFAIFFLGVLLIQLHASGLFFFLITLLIIVLKALKVDYKASLVGGLLGAIPTLPYLYYQFFSGVLCRDCSAFLTQQPVGFLPRLQHIANTVTLFSPYQFGEVLGNDYPQFFHSNPYLIPAIVISFLASLFFLLGCYNAFKQQQYRFLLWYVVLLPLIYFILGAHPIMHYYIVLSPIASLLIALGMQLFFQQKNYLLKYFPLLCFLLILAAYSVFEISFTRFLSQKKIIHGDYGPIFEVTDTLISRRLQAYVFFPNYQGLKYYAYIYAYSPKFELAVTQFLHTFPQ